MEKKRGLTFMGTGDGFTCSNCGYEKEFMEGRGFAAYDQFVKEYLEDQFTFLLIFITFD